MRTEAINRMCVAQSCCMQCPIGKILRQIPLDCRQYIEIYPVRAAWVAQEWQRNNGR